MHLQDLSHVGIKPSWEEGGYQNTIFVVHFVKNWLMCVIDCNGKISGDFSRSNKAIIHRKRPW